MAQSQLRRSSGNDIKRFTLASGAGTVVSWSIAHGRNADGTPKETAIGIVQLAEGPWWRCELLGAEPGENLTGRSVYADFIKTGPDATHSTIPVFVLK